MFSPVFLLKNRLSKDGKATDHPFHLIFGRAHALAADLTPCKMQVVGLHRAVPSATLDKIDFLFL